MKTVFISIFDGDTERVILQTEVFSRLKASGHRLVLLIRGEDRVEHYKKTYGDARVIVEALPPAASRREYFWYYLSWNSVPTHAVTVRRVREYWNTGRYVWFFAGCIAGALSHLRWWRELLRAAYAFTGEDYALSLFEQYTPSLLFAANMFSAEDARLLRQAKKLGVPTITLAKSWDVLTTKAFTRTKADRLIVYNEPNRDEAIAYGDYLSEQVVVAGFPQFDVYTRAETWQSREHFCKSVGLDPKKKYVLYGLPGDWKSPDTQSILASLDRHIIKGSFKESVQILARSHPKYRDSSERYKSSHVVFDRPGTYFGSGGEASIDTGTAAANKWTFQARDIVHLANSIYHAAAVICVDSTLTLDAAAIGVPVVLVAYDGDRSVPYQQSIAYIYERDHYRRVLRTGYPVMAHSDAELVAAIVSALREQPYRAAELEAMRTDILHELDGKSAERMAHAVLQMLDSGVSVLESSQHSD